MPNSRKTENVEYASFTYRMLASVIDTILSAILLTPIIRFIGNIFDLTKLDSIPLQIYSMSQQELMTLMRQGLPGFLLEMSIVSVIVICFWVKWGGTPGKSLLKMKIVDAKTYEKPGVTQSIIRYLGYFVSFLPFLLGFVWIYYDKRKQGFHDKLARTVVIIDRSKKQTQSEEATAPNES